MDNKHTQTKTARRLDIEKIMKQIDRLKEAEIKEKEWVRKHQTQRVF